MNVKTKSVPAQELRRQREICGVLRERLADSCPLAFVDTYGCQQNEADSEKLRAMLRDMGFSFTDSEAEADLILINTCAVREHAEQRVFGNVGALTHTKRAKPSQTICLCGCMVQQAHIAEKIRTSFRHVDIVFGPHALWRFPELLLRRLDGGERVFSVEPSDGEIAEGLPSLRTGGVRAWLSVMYGCNNFCSYCVVPYVRGRERSRRARDVLREAEELVASGCRDITLLGQNVNSYGKDLDEGVDFARLLSLVSEIDGDFRVRFMTSHPKDAGPRLFEAMAGSPKISKCLHLPVQSGSDRVLAAMNRKYTAARYLELIGQARSLMPGLVVTSDVIVGFPGETEEDFEKTLELVRRVRWDALFTFIYSPRAGTPAAGYPDPYTREDKQRRFERLTELQNSISAEIHSAYAGRTLRVLVDGLSDNAELNLSARTDGNRLVRLSGDASLIGSFAEVTIDGGNTWSLTGKLVRKEGG